MVCALTLMLATYATHCVWVSSEAYSSPSIVLAARGHDDSKIIFDDFRDAYYWLRYNTAPVSPFSIFACSQSIDVLFLKVQPQLRLFLLFSTVLYVCRTRR